jgi:hypothetical protein
VPIIRGFFDEAISNRPTEATSEASVRANPPVAEGGGPRPSQNFA